MIYTRYMTPKQHRRENTCETRDKQGERKLGFSGRRGNEESGGFCSLVNDECREEERKKKMVRNESSTYVMFAGWRLFLVVL